MLVRVCPKCKHELGLYDNYFCSECGLKLPKELILDPDTIHTHMSDMPKHTWIKDSLGHLSHFYQTINSALNWREIIPLLGLLGSGMLLLISILRSYLYTSLRVNSYLLPSSPDTLVISNVSNVSNVPNTSNNIYPRLISLSSLPVVDLSFLLTLVPKDVSLYIASSDPDKFLEALPFLDSLLSYEDKNMLNTYISEGTFDRFALFIGPRVLEPPQNIDNTTNDDNNVLNSDMSEVSESLYPYDWGFVLVNSKDIATIALLSSSKEYKNLMEAVLRQEYPSLANDHKFLTAKSASSALTKQRGKVVMYVSDDTSEEASDNTPSLFGKSLLDEFLNAYRDSIPQDIVHIIKVFNSSSERYKIIL